MLTSLPALAESYHISVYFPYCSCLLLIWYRLENEIIQFKTFVLLEVSVALSQD